MWLLFIVVVLVITALMIVLLMAIRLLSGQAKEQLNRYFLKNLETYDRLAEHKNAEIDELTGREQELTERVESLRARIQAMEEADRSRRSSHPSQTVATVEAPAGASYRNDDFLEDYAYVRRNMKLDWPEQVRSLLRELRAGETEDRTLTLCRGMLKKLPQESLYDAVTLRPAEQAELLGAIFDEEEDRYLEQWAQERGGFDILEFYGHLTDYVRSHEDQVYVRTGDPDELKDLKEDRVQVLYDPDVHEGVRVSYKNKVYDFSL